ncbi:MAG TPA: Flp family type IVb pilin [Polyangia bacterium]
MTSSWPAGVMIDTQADVLRASLLGRRSSMLKNLVKLFKDEEGATALEYALMAAAVAGVIIAVAWLLGAKVNNALSNVAAHI